MEQRCGRFLRERPAPPWLRGGLRSLSLPANGQIPCDVTTPQQIRLQLAETLVPGSYAFSVRAQIPMSTPINNMFSLVLFDKFNMVQDAAMNIAGRVIRSGLNFEGIALYWSRADMGKLSAITVGFKVKDSFSSYGDDIKRQIGEILVNFPEGFYHGIDSLAHMDVSRIDDSTNQAITPGMHLSDKWLDFTQKDRIRISLRSPPGLESTGSYMFTFPAMVPLQIPPYNVWTLSLCLANGGCITSSDSSVIITFPNPGFNIGEVHPSSASLESSDAFSPLAKGGLKASLMALLEPYMAVLGAAHLNGVKRLLTSSRVV